MRSDQSFSGKLYRALNPLWASQALSGEGAAQYGGRFNPRGTPALYCSLSPVTALREANQVGDLQPLTVVAYRAGIDRLFDARWQDFRNRMALLEGDMDANRLADAGWRASMLTRGEAPTQTFARALIADGFHGLIVPSFARGTTYEDLNIVLWRWNEGLGCTLDLIDDENRLVGH